MVVLTVLTLHHHTCPVCNRPWSHDTEWCATFVPSTTSQKMRRSLRVCDGCREWQTAHRGIIGYGDVVLPESEEENVATT